MTAWADAELKAERLTTLHEGFALVDGPEVITSWLDGIDVVTGTTITRLEQVGDAWLIHDEDGNQWQASGVIATAPLPQLHRMLPEGPASWASHPYDPTWTVVLADQEACPASLRPGLEALGINVVAIENPNGVVVHLPAQWSREHLEMERTDVGQAFLTMIEGLEETALNWVKTATLQAHRWRFGRASTLGERARLPRLVEAGDAWCEPVGTGGAALCSGAWAAAEIAWQCSQEHRPKPAPVQQTLF